MATPTKPLSTGEFARLTGLSSTAVGALIREGKLKAHKQGGKWEIPPSQLTSKWVKAAAPRTLAPRRPAKPAAPVRPQPAEKPEARMPTPPAPAEPAEQSWSVHEFSAMSYLTEKGVTEWLKMGRLKGIKAASGEWRVLERNLQVADIRRLLRK
jgi:excisionase family DNA binding protein